MAVGSRHPAPDLSAVAPEAMDFFELLRRVETDALRFGRGGADPARLGQSIRLAFAASDVVSIDRPDDPETPPSIAVNVAGLFGPEGPMPLHLTRWMLERASNRWFAGGDAHATSDTAFLDFGNMLQHRMLAFFWRAWADTRPEVQFEHESGGAVAAMIRALAGTGLTGARNDSSGGTAELRHATSLYQRVRSPARLTEYLASVTGHPVTLREFVGVWTDIPVRLQSRLGSARLGRDAVVGARFFERESRSEIRVGPLGIAEFEGLLDDPGRAEALREALLFAMGHGIAFDLCLVLKIAEVPEPRIGRMRLGRSSWLGRPKGEVADDLRLRRFAGAPPEVAA